MNQMNIKAFLNLEEIPHYTIWYYISSDTGKKTPIGERNNEPLDDVINKRNINPTKPTSKYVNKSVVPFDEDEEKSLQKAYTIFMKYSDNLFCIDIDDKEINSMEDFVDKTGIKEFENACWVKGNTKGIHIYVRVNNIKIDDFKNQQGVFNDFEGDFIKKNNMWEKTNKTINNYESEILTFDFNDIKYLFNIEKMNFKRDNNQNKIKFKPVDEGVDEGVEEEKIEMPILIKKKSNIDKPNVNTPTTDKKQEVENILRCLKAERFSVYDSWLHVLFMVCNELGLEGKEIFLEYSKRSLNSEHEKQNKNETMYMEYFYKQKKLKQEEKIKIGSGHMWAKNDNLVLYEELFHKTINWDLSEAEFAKKLKEICFNNSNILFTGKGKESEGFLYNGVYWEDLSLHNAELKQHHFDNLYNYYFDALQKEKHAFDDKYYNSLMGQIKTLNSNKTRTNVTKIFKDDNYISKVEWNKNKNLFVFENCVYDLETDKFIPSNPKDYINTSCGYEYNEGEKEMFISAKKKLKDFVNNILQESDQNYIWTLMGGCLIQGNLEEKAYFLLGGGRNGKGTLFVPFKNALGKYWGDLNMEYYTTHDKGADTPNQNLYNCRDSRVLSSVEVSDSDYNNNAVKFISSKFKTLSGNDNIYARELGSKKTANFKAGKSFIQTNVMPVFTKLDTSLRERIVVINFPYTFKVNPDSKSPNEKPIDTSLKTEFEKDIYKTAMVALLFEYYKEYKEGLVIPDSIVKYTKSYFESESVKGWIEENFDPCEKSSIDISKLCGLYEQARDKKLSVKKMKDELEAGGYIVKRGDYGFSLKNWMEKVEEVEETNHNIDDDTDDENY